MIRLFLALWACGWIALSGASRANDVVVETAWALPSADTPGRFDAYVVINNRSDSVVTLVAVDSPLAAQVRVLSRVGTEISPEIPIHAELFMAPGGVSIALDEVVLDSAQSIPIEIVLSGNLRTLVHAQVLTPEAPRPDHNDLEH